MGYPLAQRCLQFQRHGNCSPGKHTNGLKVCNFLWSKLAGMKAVLIKDMCNCKWGVAYSHFPAFIFAIFLFRQRFGMLQLCISCEWCLVCFYTIPPLVPWWITCVSPYPLFASFYLLLFFTTCLLMCSLLVFYYYWSIFGTTLWSGKAASNTLD